MMRCASSSVDGSGLFTKPRPIVRGSDGSGAQCLVTNLRNSSVCSCEYTNRLHSLTTPWLIFRTTSADASECRRHGAPLSLTSRPVIATPKALQPSESSGRADMDHHWLRRAARNGCDKQSTHNPFPRRLWQLARKLDSIHDARCICYVHNNSAHFSAVESYLRFLSLFPSNLAPYATHK